MFGMRGTGDWATDERPKDWRGQILYLYPNGSAPLTALLSMMRKEKVSDPEFNWWTKGLATMRATVVNIYTNTGLTSVYVSGGVIGTILHAKVSAADLAFFRVGHQITLRDASDLTVDVSCKIVTRVENGSSSYLSCKLLEADDNSSLGDLSDVDTMILAGNINPEGGSMPDALSDDPTKWFNYTQIHREPLEISGTALATKLRTDPQYYQRRKMETLQAHSIGIENASWWGVPTETMGANNMLERTSLGIIPAIRGGYPGQGGAGGTVSHYPTDSNYSGQTWLAGGEAWLNDQLEIAFRYGKLEKLAVCGSGALAAINQLVANNGQFSFAAETTVYGIQIRKWVTPLGTINLITHPLWSEEVTTRYIMAVIEPENIIYKYLQGRDTHFIGEGLGKTNTGYSRKDGIKEEYLTECSLEYHHPKAWLFLSGFGSLNTV